VTVLITRAREQAERFRESLASLGADVILAPSIRFEEPPDWTAVDRALRSAATYDWAILTSVNGVRALSRRLGELGLDWSSFGGVRLAAIGPATAEALGEKGVEVAVVPDRYQAEGILDALGREGIGGKRILLARAERAREILPEELRRRGALVDVAAVYRTVPCPPAAEAVAALRAGLGARCVVTFTSASTVSHFLEHLPEEALEGLRAATLASIGPITTEALESHGLRAALQPSQFTIPALVEAIRAFFESRPPRVEPSPSRPVRSD
jgi:uroporphyrinogen III methyltransferase/synthase